MLRLFAILCFLFTPVTAFALCEGSNLITALPLDEQQELRAQADEAPYSTGLLWRATRGDTQITWFGTYHFPHEKTDAHLAALIPQIESADRVYLEVSNSDTSLLEREIATNPSIMFITEGPSLIDLLGEDDWQIYKDAMDDRGIPGFMAAKFKPMWAAMMLGIGPCEARNGVMDGVGIDKLVGEHAAQIGNPSRSLEDYRTLLTMLDSFPQEDQLDMIRLFFAWKGDADDMAYTLRDRYLAQDVGLIWEFSRKISLEFGGDSAAEDFALFEKQMLTDRNRGWVDLLLADVEGQKVFAAVGAAHLPGTNGVLYMLEQEGFEIERLDFAP